jgi:hypothetical protein
MRKPVLAEAHHPQKLVLEDIARMRVLSALILASW